MKRPPEPLSTRAGLLPLPALCSLTLTLTLLFPRCSSLSLPLGASHSPPPTLSQPSPLARLLLSSAPEPFRAAARQTVVAGGWVKTGRTAEKDSFAFLELNDGSCVANLQAEREGAGERREGRERGGGGRAGWGGLEEGAKEGEDSSTS